MPVKNRVLVIGDQHRPFEHPLYLKFCKDVYKRFNCNRVVNIGDEWDNCALSRFSLDPDGKSPKDEYCEAVEASKPWYKAFPKMEVVESNHGLRPYKKAFEAGIPHLFMKSYRDYMKAPKTWTWQNHIMIDGVKYFHGEPFGGQNGHINAMIKNRTSVVIGHIHCFAGVAYSKSPANQLFAMNVGCGIDDTTYPFKYAREQATRPTLGCGVVLEGKEAIFIPMR